MGPFFGYGGSSVNNTFKTQGKKKNENNKEERVTTGRSQSGRDQEVNIPGSMSLNFFLDPLSRPHFIQPVRMCCLQHLL